MSDKPKLMKRRNIFKSELLEICERQLLSGKISLDDKTAETHIRLIKLENRSSVVNWIKAYGFCEYSGEPINGQEIDFDHKIPNALLYEGDEIEWEVLLRKWHKVKTKDDVKRIAKAKRQAGETGQYARRKRRGESLIKGRSEIQSAGFRPTPDNYNAWGNAKGFRRDYKPNVRMDD